MVGVSSSSSSWRIIRYGNLRGLQTRRARQRRLRKEEVGSLFVFFFRLKFRGIYEEGGRKGGREGKVERYRGMNNGVFLFSSLPPSLPPFRSSFLPPSLPLSFFFLLLLLPLYPLDEFVQIQFRPKIFFRSVEMHDSFNIDD